MQRTRDILPDEQRSVLLFLLFCVPYFQTFVSAASFSVVIHLLLLKTASQQKEEVEGRKVWEKRAETRQWEEVRDRAGEGGRRAGTCCGVSTPYCYNTTLTGLCNQTGLAHSRHRLHSLLYNCINCCSELRRSMRAGGRETQSHTHTHTHRLLHLVLMTGWLHCTAARLGRQGRSHWVNFHRTFISSSDVDRCLTANKTNYI